MSEREYTLTFQPFEDAQKARPGGLIHYANYRLTFTIEPPMEVHDPQVVGDYMSDSSLFGAESPAARARLTHSDEEKTHGNLMVSAHSVRDGSARLEAQEFIREKFEAALNPLGEIALRFVFKAQEDIEPRASIAE